MDDLLLSNCYKRRKNLNLDFFLERYTMVFSSYRLFKTNEVNE